MIETSLNILADQPIGTISPRLYGHFAEHLGRCCYDGLWRTPDPSTNGGTTDRFHTGAVAALKAMPIPMLRWPGGCYADHYHWRDGIGSPSERTHRLGMSCGLQVEDDNSLGTHEFMALCARLGAEPYLAGNVGSGSPQELCDWVEYCNASASTTLTEMRRANGSAKPFGVKLWGVGNENWGCGGNFDAPSYAREYRRFATMLRHVDPGAELVIAGSGDAMAHDDKLNTWNAELLQTLRPHLHLIDHLSIHKYWVHGGSETTFSESEYYALLTEAQSTEAFIIQTTEIIRAETGGRRKIGIALDEWGVWHPEAREWGPGDMARRTPVTYEQAGTLRDAIAAAIALETFHRQCAVLSLANLAQVVNVLHAPVLTDGDQVVLTPTYHALRMHAPHIGALALPVEIVKSDPLADGSSAVSATASYNAQGTTITLINRHFDQAAAVHLMGVQHVQQTHGQLLSADHANAQNSLRTPAQVQPVAFTVSADGSDRWQVELPPHSIATITLA